MPAIGQHGVTLSTRCCKNQANPDRPRLHPTLLVGEIIAHSMAMVVAAPRLEEGRSTQSLAPRYESLIRLAEAIRSHRDEKDLFQLLADELRQVVPFDVMAHCDHAGNKVNWHFSKGYDPAKHGISNTPNEETVAWWVDRTQQPVVLQVAH